MLCCSQMQRFESSLSMPLHEVKMHRESTTSLYTWGHYSVPYRLADGQAGFLLGDMSQAPNDNALIQQSHSQGRHGKSKRATHNELGIHLHLLFIGQGRQAFAVVHLNKLDHWIVQGQPARQRMDLVLQGLHAHQALGADRQAEPTKSNWEWTQDS